MMPLSAGVVPFMNAVGGSLYTCQKQLTVNTPVNTLYKVFAKVFTKVFQRERVLPRVFTSFVLGVVERVTSPRDHNSVRSCLLNFRLITTSVHYPGTTLDELPF